MKKSFRIALVVVGWVIALVFVFTAFSLGREYGFGVLSWGLIIVAVLPLTLMTVGYLRSRMVSRRKG